MLRSRWLVPSLCLLVAACGRGATALDCALLTAADTGEFTTAGGRRLQYALYEPKDAAPGKQYPLVVFLHGAGGMRPERNVDRLWDGAGQCFEQLPEECFFFAPQANDKWAGIPWEQVPYTMSQDPGVQNNAVAECLDALVKAKPIDPERIYVAGTSMGSMGMWDLASRRPGLFAAGISCCGGFDAAQAPKLTGMRFRVFHGDADNIVPIAGSQAMVDALKAADGQVEYTVLPGANHFIWDTVYRDKANMNWLFEQRRKADEEAARPTRQGGAGGQSAAGAPVDRDAIRTWTPEKGKPVEGRFSKILVVIKKRSGTELRLDAETLSPEDREFVRSLFQD
jgi:predicted esterase